jgi:hypothetical protein
MCLQIAMCFNQRGHHQAKIIQYIKGMLMDICFHEILTKYFLLLQFVMLYKLHLTWPELYTL